jgi:hypothetical protein
MWIAANGTVNFLGAAWHLGSTGQTTPSYLQFFGGGNNQPYIQMQTADGSKNAYLGLSHNGSLCAAPLAPGNDCAVGTIITTGTVMTVAAVGGATINAQSCYDYSVLVPSATTGMAAAASPAGPLGVNWTNLSWSAYVLANGSVQVHVCNPTASSVSPAAMNFNVKAYN